MANDTLGQGIRLCARQLDHDIYEAAHTPRTDISLPKKNRIYYMTRVFNRTMVVAGGLMLAIGLTSTGCEVLLPEKTSEALDFSCEGCHTNKSLVQSLASSEVEVPEGGG